MCQMVWQSEAIERDADSPLRPSIKKEENPFQETKS